MEAKEKQYAVSREEGDVVLTYKIPLSVLYPNPEDSEGVFQKVVDAIIESGEVTSIVIVSERNYVYVKEEADLFNDVANTYKSILQSDLSVPFGADIQRSFPNEVSVFNYVLFDRLKRDPIGAYVFGVRAEREMKVRAKSDKSAALSGLLEKFDSLMNEISGLKIVQKSTPFILGYKIGDRAPYKALLKPLIRPNFSYTRIMSEPPISAIETETYKLDDGEGTEVTIYRLPGVSQYLYHLSPPELLLNVDEYNILDQVRAALIDYKPQEAEFTDPIRMREIFYNIGRDLTLCRALDR